VILLEEMENNKMAKTCNSSTITKVLVERLLIFSRDSFSILLETLAVHGSDRYTLC